MIPSTPQIVIESRTGNIILEPMRMAKLKAFSNGVMVSLTIKPRVASGTLV